MSQTNEPHASPATEAFTIPAILGRTCATLRRNAFMFLALALPSSMPSVLIGFAIAEGDAAAMALRCAGFIISTLFEGAVAYIVFMGFRGRKAGFFESIRLCLAHFFPLFLCVLAGLFLTMVGYALFIIPGIILSCMWVAAVPACVVEKLGPMQSLDRSAKLTSGRRLRIFGLLILTRLPYPMALISLYASIPYEDHTAFIISGIGTLVYVLQTAFISVMAVTIYHTLRSIKEGVASDELVTVFD